MNNRTLDVYYKGHIVGTLAETINREIVFEYSDSWLSNGFSISPFSLPLRKGVFAPPVNNADGFHGLFGVFADSLPDSWGELLLSRALQSKGINPQLSSIERLAYVGTSGMGALEYYPTKTIQFSTGKYGYDEIAEACMDILSSKTSDRLDTLYQLGGSSGGARPKILISENGEEWIVKFPGRTDATNVGQMEYDYSLCAKECGIIMTETDLLPSHICEGYFKTKRFDRNGTDKVFTVSAAALLEINTQKQYRDYSDLMKLVSVLTREDKRQLDQMFRIMCFNIFAHNFDDHFKNFAFLCDETRWSLAPAYDLTYSMTYFMSHTTTVNGKGIGIKDEDLIAVGTAAGLAKAKCEEIIFMIKENTKELSQYNTWNTQPIGKISLKEKLSDIDKNDQY